MKNLYLKDFSKHFLNVSLALLCVTVLFIAFLSSRQEQEEAPLVEAPVSVYDALKKECHIDTNGYGTCSYSADSAVFFEISWDPEGSEVRIYRSGSKDEAYYIPFDNIELTLVSIDRAGTYYGYEFHFNSMCIPIHAGDQLRREFRAYSDHSSEFFYKLGPLPAYVSPINGMIYGKGYVCQEESFPK